MNLSILNNCIRKCEQCIRCRVYTPFGPIPGDGNPNAKIVIVSSPLHGIISPMEGMMELYINKWFDFYKIDKNQVYFTLSIKCAAEDTSGHNIAKTCASWAVHECSLIKPKAVFVFGKQSKKCAEALISNGFLVYFYPESLFLMSSKKHTDVHKDMFLKMKGFIDE